VRKGCIEAGFELVGELYQNYVCDGIVVIVNARRRGVIGPTCICTDARMACQALDACALASLSTSRNLPEGIARSLSLPDHICYCLVSSHRKTRHSVSSQSGGSVSPSPSLQASTALPLTSWLHIHLPADVRSFLFTFAVDLAPSSRTGSSSSTTAATPNTLVETTELIVLVR
jgi:hypothetical protein